MENWILMTFKRCIEKEQQKHTQLHVGKIVANFEHQKKFWLDSFSMWPQSTFLHLPPSYLGNKKLWGAVTSCCSYNCFYLEALEHYLVFAKAIKLIHLFFFQVYLPLVTTMENLMPLSYGVSLSIDTLLSSTFCHNDMRIFYDKIISNGLHFYMGVSCIMLPYSAAFVKVSRFVINMSLSPYIVHINLYVQYELGSWTSHVIIHLDCSNKHCSHLKNTSLKKKVNNGACHEKCCK
jgi:hypothetical protein